MLEETAADIAALRSPCIQCGGCTKVCPSYRHGGCDPKRVMGGDPSTVNFCIGCGKCSLQCPKTDPKRVMMTLKAEARGLTGPPEIYGRCGYIIPEPDPAVYGDIPVPEDGDGVYVMPGCVAKRKSPFILYASRKALDYVGIPNMELPGNTCCTYPVVFRLRPKADNAGDIARLGASQKDRDTVTLCGGCKYELLAQEVNFPHISEYLAHHLDRIRQLPGAKLRVALEPGCSAERFQGEMRKVVEACGCEIVNHASGCCGKGTDRVGAPLMDEREAECRGADAIVVGCPNCLSFYDSYPNGIPVLHISELICLAAGDSFTQKYHRIKLEAAR